MGICCLHYNVCNFDALIVHCSEAQRPWSLFLLPPFILTGKTLFYMDKMNDLRYTQIFWSVRERFNQKISCKPQTIQNVGIFFFFLPPLVFSMFRSEDLIIPITKISCQKILYLVYTSVQYAYLWHRQSSIICTSQDKNVVWIDYPLIYINFIDLWLSYFYFLHRFRLSPSHWLTSPLCLGYTGKYVGLGATK